MIRKKTCDGDDNENLPSILSGRQTTTNPFLDDQCLYFSMEKNKMIKMERKSILILEKNT